MNAPIARPGILDITPYKGGESAVPGVSRIIKLASNEGALGPSPRAMEAYRQLAADLHRYPDGGADELRRAIADHHGLDVDRVVCGAGSDELITLLCRAYVGPGDEILYSRHGFLMYAINAKAVGATSITAPEKNLTADVDALLAAVTPRTKICFLANPNNPTGTYLPADEVKRLRAGLPDHVILAIDAAYAEFVTRNDYSAGAELVEATTNTVMLRTFSKLYALAGLRLGWGYFPTAIADVMHRVRNPFNVSTAAQAAGLAALADTAYAELCRIHNDYWLSWLTGQAREMGLEAVPSVGNFLLIRFPTDAGRNSAAADGFLRSKGIIARPVAGYGLGEYLRITIGKDDEMRETAAALREFMG